MTDPDETPDGPIVRAVPFEASDRFAKAAAAWHLANPPSEKKRKKVKASELALVELKGAIHYAERHHHQRPSKRNRIEDKLIAAIDGDKD